MMRASRCRALLAGIALLALLPAGCGAQVKEPAVAGAFYPGERTALARAVDGYLAKAAVPSADGELVALIAPHAGYQFSGPVAAYSYKQLAGRDIRTVILIGPAHQATVNGAAVYPKGGWRTPLGTVPINEKLAAALLDPQAGVTAYPAAFAKEHSLEVQLPFLQRTLKEFSIVPILVGNPTRESYAHLAAKLAQLLREDRRTLLVCSTDLSHYHDAATAGKKDARITDAIQRLAVGDLERLLMNREGEACGGFPVLYTLAAARGAGATNGVLYKYADSGDASGDKRQVVGYAAMGLYRTPLTPERRSELLSLAKATVASYVTSKQIPEVASLDPLLSADGAAFVTLKEKNGALRGCIGTIQPVMPLCRSVVSNAVAAAARDHRFPPVRPEELPGLEVEVTVLSPLEPVADLKEVRIGTHGLYLEAAGTSSVFLPQVPVEQGWDLPTYLRELALKAGLPPDGWRKGRLSRFTADIIH